MFWQQWISLPCHSNGDAASTPSNITHHILWSELRPPTMGWLAAQQQQPQEPILKHFTSMDGCIEEKINEIKKAKLPTKEQKPDTKVVKDAVLQDDCGIFLQLLCEQNSNELVFCWKQWPASILTKRRRRTTSKRKEKGRYRSEIKFVLTNILWPHLLHGAVTVVQPRIRG